jgi:hypothetical protein
MAAACEFSEHGRAGTQYQEDRSVFGPLLTWRGMPVARLTQKADARVDALMTRQFKAAGA